jgi:hypothetical protein
MRQSMVRGVALLVLAFLIVPAGFSKSPVKSKTNNGDKSTDDTTTTADATAAASNTIAAGTGCSRHNRSCGARRARASSATTRGQHESRE